MPQMMPLNWLSMFMYLNFILSMFSIIMFNFTLINPPQNIKSLLPLSSTNWSW